MSVETNSYCHLACGRDEGQEAVHCALGKIRWSSMDDSACPKSHIHLLCAPCLVSFVIRLVHRCLSGHCIEMIVVTWLYVPSNIAN